MEECKTLFKQTGLLQCEKLFNESNLVHQDYTKKILQMTEPKRLGRLDAYEKATSPWFQVVDVAEDIFDFSCTVFPFVALTYMYLEGYVLSKKARMFPPVPEPDRQSLRESMELAIVSGAF